MNQKHSLLKWAAIIVPCVAAGLAIWPPQTQLKGGIDLVGGYSAIFEIDTTGLSAAETRDLSTQVMEILKRRVDPNGQLNLIWRPIGNNRLEIQMPMPSKVALERRRDFDHALDLIDGRNFTRNELEAALNSDPEAVDEELSKLLKAAPPAQIDELLAPVPDEPVGLRQEVRQMLLQGVQSRKPLLDECREVFEAYQKTTASGTEQDADAALEKYDEAVAAAQDTNLAPNRLKDGLAIENTKEREKVLDQIIAAHPSLEPLIKNSIVTHDAWAARKGVLEDPADLKRRIRGAGVLEFRILAERDPSNPAMLTATQPHLRQPIATWTEQLSERGPRPRAGDEYQWFEVDNIVAFLNLRNVTEYDEVKDGRPVITEQYAGKYYVLAHTGPETSLLKSEEHPWQLRDAYATRDPRTGYPAVSFEFDARGGTLFARMTGDNVEKPMVILLDDVAQSYAVINEQIRERGQISGRGFTQEDVNNLVRTLKAGSLPARLKEVPISEKNIGPSLGEHNRRMGMQAAIAGLAVTVVFMLVYYRMSGVLADFALFMNVLLTLGIMATLEATFTLPGIAGLILAMGMAVDANVLINERIREERERGTAIRKAVRLGYERAFSTIVDANITTLITCVILGYVGSEEVKGFAMVLGFGITTSVFTAVFVTRWLMTAMIERGWVTEAKMMRLIGVPSVNWLGLRRIFWPVSAVLVLLGVGGFAASVAKDPSTVFDIEFLGGTAVTIELKPGVTMTEEEVRRRIASPTGAEGEPSAASWLADAAERMTGSVEVTPNLPSGFDVRSEVLNWEQLAALYRPAFSEVLASDGISGRGNTASFQFSGDAQVNQAMFDNLLADAVQYVERASRRMAGARSQTVQELGTETEQVDAFEVVTVETDRQLVQTAIVAAMGDRLQIDKPIGFTVVTNPRIAPEGHFPIEEGDRFLDDVIEGTVPNTHYDIQRYRGGVALVFDELDPPQTIAAIEKRIREIRLQPEFENFQWRDYMIQGLSTEVGEAETTSDADQNAQAYTRFALVVVDESVPYSEDPSRWEQALARPELEQVKQALRSEKSLQKVIQFAPQVAGQARNQAFLALLLSLVGIIAYVWIRFGSFQFGLAAIIALVHDVGIVLGLLTLGHFIFGLPPADLLLISDFKIDMPVVAALLTLVGFSINDTIVIFDRIRENRGKSRQLPANMINDSINQTMSRTILTSGTTIFTLLIMYIWGGEGIHGFAYAMLAGAIVGTYSSVGIAAPLIYRPRVLHVIFYIFTALAIFAISAIVSTAPVFLAVAGVVIAVALVFAFRREFAMERVPA